VHGPNVSDVQEGETLKFLDGGHEHWAIVLKVTSVQGGEDLYRIHAIDDDKEPFPNIMYDSRDALVRGGICKWLAWSVAMCDVNHSKRNQENAPMASWMFSVASSTQNPLEPVHPPHSRLDAFFPSAKPFQHDRILATSSQKR
jgi:hypothetical protein